MNEHSGTMIGRRQFLQLAATGATSLWLAGRSMAADNTAQPVIDVHIHTNFSDDVLRRQAQRISGVDFTPQGLLAEMAEHHVQHALALGFESDGTELSHHADNPMGWDTYSQHQAALKPVSFIGGINPHRLDDANLRRLEQSLSTQRVKGLKIYLGYYHLHPDDDKYKPVYELAARHNIPVIFHTGDTYSANAKVRYAHPLRIDDVAVDFREVTFVVAHLGNPWTMDAAELLYKNPNVYGDLSGFLVGDAQYFRNPQNAEGITDAVERIREAAAWVENPQKMLYGSDWPLVPMGAYLEFVRRAIKPEHQQAVLFANAQRIFRLG